MRLRRLEWLGNNFSILLDWLARSLPIDYALSAASPVGRAIEANLLQVDRRRWRMSGAFRDQCT